MSPEFFKNIFEKKKLTAKILQKGSQTSIFGIQYFFKVFTVSSVTFFFVNLLQTFFGLCYLCQYCAKRLLTTQTPCLRSLCLRREGGSHPDRVQACNIGIYIVHCSQMVIITYIHMYKGFIDIYTVIYTYMYIRCMCGTIQPTLA